MIDIVRVLSQITKEGVENDDIDELGQGVEVNHSSCTVELSMKMDEKTHIVPDDTVFNAPLGNSFGLLHSPMPIILSVARYLQSI